MALVSGSTIVFEDGVIIPMRFVATIADEDTVVRSQLGGDRRTPPGVTT
jgi:hypothetical protein